MKVLNKKQIKRIYKILEEQFGTKDLDLNYVFLQDEEDNIYLTNRETFDIDLKKLKVKKMGIHFGRLINNKIILSIEGSQLVGYKSTKNIIALNDEEVQGYIHGLKIKKEHLNDLVLVRGQNNFFGSTKVIDNKLLNNTPKNRRLR